MEKSRLFRSCSRSKCSINSVIVRYSCIHSGQSKPSFCNEPSPNEYCRNCCSIIVFEVFDCNDNLDCIMKNDYHHYQQMDPMMDHNHQFQILIHSFLKIIHLIMSKKQSKIFYLKVPNATPEQTTLDDAPINVPLPPRQAPNAIVNGILSMNDDDKADIQINTNIATINLEFSGTELMKSCVNCPIHQRNFNSANASITTNNAAKKINVDHSTLPIIDSSSCLSDTTNNNIAPNIAIHPKLKSNSGIDCIKNKPITIDITITDFINNGQSRILYLTLVRPPLRLNK
ncbi:hypothetical protein DERP_008969 [Dermatophagoides pteronyssinus]|uniref:Uncharacterized protein n=1 Tax=Dermatophagoides pteronyssinus TaxID=6956 RepID=A0ABQ8JG48_DERPT|nr:hypothetical protein DERP_008969 [Dermatophagoides pteronyssinus]